MNKLGAKLLGKTEGKVKTEEGVRGEYIPKPFELVIIGKALEFLRELLP